MGSYRKDVIHSIGLRPGSDKAVIESPQTAIRLLTLSQRNATQAIRSSERGVVKSFKQDVLQALGANSIGLRAGFDKLVIEWLQTAIRVLTRSQRNTTQAIERIRARLAPNWTSCSNSSALPSVVS